MFFYQLSVFLIFLYSCYIDIDILISCILFLMFIILYLYYYIYIIFTSTIPNLYIKKLCYACSYVMFVLNILILT